MTANTAEFYHRMSSSEIERLMYITNDPMYATLFVHDEPIPERTLEVWDNGGDSAERAYIKSLMIDAPLKAKQKLRVSISNEIQSVLGKLKLIREIFALSDILESVFGKSAFDKLKTELIKQGFGYYAVDVIKKQLEQLESKLDDPDPK